jgi:hypothetical protein
MYGASLFISINGSVKNNIWPLGVKVGYIVGLRVEMTKPKSKMPNEGEHMNSIW